MKNFRQLRLENGLTQQELSAILNISKSTCGSWERGETQPTNDQLIQIANYFDVTIDYLVGRENDIGIINVKGDVIGKPEMRPQTIKVAKKIDQLNDIGLAVVLGYVVRLLEQPEYLQK